MEILCIICSFKNYNEFFKNIYLLFLPELTIIYVNSRYLLKNNVNLRN